MILEMKKAGYEAAKNDEIRSAALCSVFMKAIENLPMGVCTIMMAEEWFKGYDQRVDEELEELEKKI